ncbi:MAG TPA: FAD-dependent oxidoreductase, partial [Woeseiaceae bacterium]|nr:FAD-dependent oxidoreductase [Woeseiaceae bacterium]
MQRKTAIVAGAGIVGLTCAHRLQRSGLATTVIAPDVSDAPASWGNAGHLAVEQVEPLASRKAMRKAMRHWLAGSGPVRLPPADLPRWLPFFLRLLRASGEGRFSAGTAALRSCMQRAGASWRGILDEIGHPELLIECGHFVVWESQASAESGRAAWRSADTGPASFRDTTAEEREQLDSLIGQRIAGAIRFAGTGQ